MPLSILLPLVIGGITFIALLLHGLGLSSRKRIDSAETARIAWRDEFPEVTPIRVILCRDQHAALIMTAQDPGVVFAMGADSTARFLTGARFHKTARGLFCGGLNLIYQFWIHIETIGRLPRWVETVMNTPSHHRVHHGRNPRYLDANYAGVFIIWDRIFGTFVPELDEEKPDYGLVRNLGTFNPLRVAFHEWVGIWRDATQPGLTLKQRLNYCVKPPGWSHDASRDTSETIRANHLARHPEKRGGPGFETDRLPAD